MHIKHHTRNSCTFRVLWVLLALESHTTLLTSWVAPEATLLHWSSTLTRCYFQSEHPLRAIWNADVSGGEWHICAISRHLPSTRHAHEARGLENVVEVITLSEVSRVLRQTSPTELTTESVCWAASRCERVRLCDCSWLDKPARSADF